MIELQVPLLLVCTGNGSHAGAKRRELALLRPWTDRPDIDWMISQAPVEAQAEAQARRPKPFEFGFEAAGTLITQSADGTRKERGRSKVEIIGLPNGQVMVRPRACPYCRREWPQLTDRLFAFANLQIPDPKTGLVTLDVSVSNTR